jgi:hypothetical protein
VAKTSDQEVTTYLTQQLDRFGLRHWSVDITCHDGRDVGPDNEGNARTGAVQHWVSCHEADMDVAVGRSRKATFHTVRHEVLHLVMADMNIQFDDVAQQLGPEAQRLARSAWGRAEEQAVRRLEKVIRQ